MKKRAFTMIELIISLAILAILVVGMWVLINPVEQLAKANDGAKQNNAKELLDSITRYTVSMNNEFPWNNTTTGPRQPDARYSSENAPMNEWIQVLIDAQEIKEGSLDKLTTGDYIVLKDIGSTAAVYVCFEPESQVSKIQAAERCADPSSKRTVAGYPLCATTDGSVTAEGAAPNFNCVY